MRLNRVAFIEYKSVLDNLPTDKRKYIETPSNSNEFYLAIYKGNIVGGVSLEYQKNNVIYIKGLFSIEKGYGKKILRELEKWFPNSWLMVNCIGSGLHSYYYLLEYNEYLYLPCIDKRFKDESYYEMIKFTGDN